MTEWLLLLAAVLLTACAAYFVAAEFSLVALDRPTVQRAVDAGDTAARPVLTSLRTLSTQLSAAQVGITLTTLLTGFIAEPAIGGLIRGPLLGLGVPTSAVPAVSTTVAMLLATVASMIGGELVPQFLGLSAPLPTAKVVTRPVRMFSILAKPLIVVLNGSANAFLRRLGIEPQEELSAARTPQELASMVRRSAEAGTIDEDTARLLTRSLGFGERTADDVMTPRVRCETVERAASAADVLTLARRTGHSRFPVIGDDLDDVDGVVHVKRALAVPHERRQEVPVSALMVDALHVPETIRLDPLLLLLRRHSFQMAVVLDEYGGTSGVVTLEDVIEEIVGEVADEHDRRGPQAHVRRDGTWMVPGLWRTDEVRDRVGATIPEASTYETLGGFVMARLGRVPEVGDEVEIEGWHLTVEGMDGRRVDRLRLEARDALPKEGEGPGETGAPGASSGIRQQEETR
ncbi:hemolysin family protein [Arsenicicoccus dermatophilus]|uniref:hemolysin family protein n=1 Tax=Arsenicicoccus dermatophilus TaxID=1076331 RepID=UPI003891BA7B